jgi:hypothetical protein
MTTAFRAKNRNLDSVSRKLGGIPNPWQRSTKRRPCAVCGGAGCLRAGPDRSPVAVVCTVVESVRPVGMVGYLHVLSDTGPTWAPWRCSLPKLASMEANRDR